MKTEEEEERKSPRECRNYSVNFKTSQLAQSFSTNSCLFRFSFVDVFNRKTKHTHTHETKNVQRDRRNHQLREKGRCAMCTSKRFILHTTKIKQKHLVKKMMNVLFLPLLFEIPVEINTHC